MTKKDLVRAIAKDLGYTQVDTKEVVQHTLDQLIETVTEKGRIELRNFGVFEVRRRSARTARNPRTGEKVDVPAKNVIRFKPGKEMRVRVREETEPIEV